MHLFYLHHLVVFWNNQRLGDLFYDKRASSNIQFFLLFLSRSCVNIGCSCCEESRVCVWNWYKMLFTSSARSCVLILSFAISSAATSFTSVWKGMEGSKMKRCLTCLLLAKSLRFLWRPFVKKSLHFKFMVGAFSLHQPFSTSCWTLSSKWGIVL